MKNILIASILLLSSFVSSGLQKENGDKTTTLIINLEGVRNNTGVIRIAIFEKNKGFPDKAEMAVKHVSVMAKEGLTTVQIPDMPLGEYAISLLHDENANGKMDFNMFGIPIEGYGFSNNPRVILSAPSFNESKFSVLSANEVISVQIKY